MLLSIGVIGLLDEEELSGGVWDGGVVGGCGGSGGGDLEQGESWCVLERGWDKNGCDENGVEVIDDFCWLYLQLHFSFELLLLRR